MIFRFIYFNTHYAKLDGKIYKNDIKDVKIHLNGDDADDNIKQLNKCPEIEKLFITKASENSISQFRNFHNLNHLMVMDSEISSSDSEKISTFQSLKDLIITNYSTVDFKGFTNDIVSSITFILSKVVNLEALSECQSLKNLAINYSTVSDNCIIMEDNKFVMKDRSVFASFDYVENLSIFVNKIEDISGILEMDSLKEFKVDKEIISEDDKKLLEDKGISVIEKGN